MEGGKRGRAEVGQGAVQIHQRAGTLEGQARRGGGDKQNTERNTKYKKNTENAETTTTQRNLVRIRIGIAGIQSVATERLALKSIPDSNMFRAVTRDSKNFRAEAREIKSPIEFVQTQFLEGERGNIVKCRGRGSREQTETGMHLQRAWEDQEQMQTELEEETRYRVTCTTRLRSMRTRTETAFEENMRQGVRCRTRLRHRRTDIAKELRFQQNRQEKKTLRYDDIAGVRRRRHRQRQREKRIFRCTCHSGVGVRCVSKHQVYMIIDASTRQNPQS